MSRPSSVLEWAPGAAGPLLAEDDRWWHRAACLGADTEIFFARPDAAPVAIAEAKAFCAGCPVAGECLRDGVKTNDIHAVRGGLTWPERQQALAASGEQPVPVCGKKLHLMDAANTGARGRCLACQRVRKERRREAERVKRTGSLSPQSGHRAA